MGKAIFRFYEELNDFLPDRRRKRDFTVKIKGKISIGKMVRNLSVPLEVVDLILANGRSVDFGYIIRNGDRISVYPEFESIDIRNVTRLRERPLRGTRFIADAELDEIAGHMRSLGFDVYWDSSLSDQDLIDISIKEKRIILTKNRNFLRQRTAPRVIHVKPGTTREQVRGVMGQLDLK